MKGNLIPVYLHQVNIKNNLNYIKMFERMVNTTPYMDNKNEVISGLVGTTLGGTILTTPYRRPDPVNTNGVFDYVMNKKDQQNQAYTVALNDLSEQKAITKLSPASITGDNNILNQNMVKLLSNNNINDNTKISQNDLFPMILFPPTQQALPTAKVLEGFSFKK